MTKQTFYFRHDHNARNDQKILQLRARFGNAEGYGIFWFIVEAMHETDDGRIRSSASPELALSFGLATEKVENVLRFCIDIGLFIEDGGYVYSPRVVEHLEFRKERSESGKRGGIRSGKVRRNEVQLEAEVEAELEQRKGKERKVEERTDTRALGRDDRQRAEELLAAWKSYGLQGIDGDVDSLAPDWGRSQYDPAMLDVCRLYGESYRLARRINELLTALGDPPLETFRVFPARNFYQMFIAAPAGGRRTWRDYVGMDVWFVFEKADHKTLREFSQSSHAADFPTLFQQ